MRNYGGYTWSSLLEEYTCQTFFFMGMMNREQKETEEQMNGKQTTLADYRWCYMVNVRDIIKIDLVSKGFKEFRDKLKGVGNVADNTR